MDMNDAELGAPLGEQPAVLADDMPGGAPGPSARAGPPAPKETRRTLKKREEAPKFEKEPAKRKQVRRDLWDRLMKILNTLHHETGDEYVVLVASPDLPTPASASSPALHDAEIELCQLCMAALANRSAEPAVACDGFHDSPIR